MSSRWTSMQLTVGQLSYNPLYYNGDDNEEEENENANLWAIVCWFSKGISDELMGQLRPFLVVTPDFDLFVCWICTLQLLLLSPSVSEVNTITLKLNCLSNINSTKSVSWQLSKLHLVMKIFSSFETNIASPEIAQFIRGKMSHSGFPKRPDYFLQNFLVFVCLVGNKCALRHCCFMKAQTEGYKLHLAALLLSSIN